MFALALPTGTGSVSLNRSLPRVRRGFSLIELVIVVVIIGIIAAIAVPRMSRGSQGASDGALTANLTVLRNAIDLYQTEHQAYPCTGGTYNTAADFVKQLTQYTDGNGAAVSVKDSSHPYGPYLRKVPQLPVGSNKGSATTKIAAADNETTGLTTDGWIYYPNTGEIKANLPVGEKDGKDNPYYQY